MKDSFIFEGKKYISAKRASEISDYSSDYIGQLCRAEKLDCRMIGRSWFVTEESIHLHQANVLHDEIYRNRIENLKGGKKAKASVTAVSTASSRVAESASTGAVSAALPISSQMSVSEEKPAAIAPVVAPVVSLKYEVDDRPLMPVLLKGDEGEMKPAVRKPITSSAAFHVPVSMSPCAVRAGSDVGVSLSPQIENTPVRAADRETYPEIARSIILRRALNAAIAVTLVIGLFAGGVFLLGSSGDANDSHVASASASVYDALRSASSLVQNGFDSIIALFGHGKEVAMNQAPAVNPISGTGPTTNAPLSDQGSQTAEQGIAIAPSSGSVSADEALKQKIQANFSDQVEVHPDQSGTTGVITPVFREAKGKDFIYVMVPVAGTRSP